VSNVLSEEKKQQVVALGRLGRSLRLYTRRQAAFSSLGGRQVMIPKFRHSSFGEAALSTFAKNARSFVSNAGMMLQSEPRSPYFRALCSVITRSEPARAFASLCKMRIC